MLWCGTGLYQARKNWGPNTTPGLNGLAEATTELRRRILDIIRHGHTGEAEYLLSAMDQIYSTLVTFDFNDSITGGLRRRTDTVRAVLGTYARRCHNKLASGEVGDWPWKPWRQASAMSRDEKTGQFKSGGGDTAPQQQTKTQAHRSDRQRSIEGSAVAPSSLPLR